MKELAKSFWAWIIAPIATCHRCGGVMKEVGLSGYLCCVECEKYDYEK